MPPSPQRAWGGGGDGAADIIHGAAAGIAFEHEVQALAAGGEGNEEVGGSGGADLEAAVTLLVIPVIELGDAALALPELQAMVVAPQP